MDKNEADKKIAELRDEIGEARPALLRAGRARSVTAHTTGFIANWSISKGGTSGADRPGFTDATRGRQSARSVRPNPHRVPMLSLDNTYSEAEVGKFLSAYHRSFCRTRKFRS